MPYFPFAGGFFWTCFLPPVYGADAFEKGPRRLIRRRDYRDAGPNPTNVDRGVGILGGLPATSGRPPSEQLADFWFIYESFGLSPIGG